MPQEKENILVTIVIVSVFLVLVGAFLLLLLFVFLRRQRKNKQEKEEMKNRFEQTLLKTQLEIQEQTFKYISQEIHDNIGQVLSLVRLNLNTLGENANGEKVEATDELLGKAIKDLRDLSHNLQNNRLHDIGIIESLRQLLFSLEKSGRYQTRFIASDHFYIVDANNDIILYRMIQEIINNIIKHANARTIDVKIDSLPDLTTVTIGDDGIGFNTSVLKESRTGIGLQNIANRARMINASVDIKSTPGSGTVITLLIRSKQIPV
ncbi:sensor histidine kinase [Sediminibacterium soli]|uniref:sensor histidine kinase n=1 Tax=Sediminibacterium soli TaxID=2698829 RepID=UPI00137B7020|nr:ATP-binding protein [Sediminibacterium soli]NCI47622.1 sensor histidine kinase [Sediminibacterium soli]